MRISTFLVFFCCLAQPLLAEGTADSKSTGPGQLRSLGKCLELPAGPIVDGTTVVIGTCRDSSRQLWSFVDQGFWVSVVGLGGRCLVPGRIRPSGNQEVAIGPCDGSQDHLWFVQGPLDLAASIVHGATGFCLDVLGSNTADGTPILLFECRGTANQVWSFRERVEDLPSAPLKSLGHCLEDSGGRALLHPCSGRSTQQWRLVDGGDGSLRIFSFRQRCMVPGQIRPSGNQEVALGACNGTEENRWSLDGQFPGAIHLIHQDTGLCLDVLGSQTAPGTPILLFECRGTPNQTWSFVDTPFPAPLLLPYFEVDFSSSSAPTTLFALRNDGTEAVTVQVDYFPRGLQQVTELWTLAPRAVRTVNLRSVSGLRDPDPVFDITRGHIGITAVDPDSLAPTSVQNLSGDYFRLDDANDFASGELLLSLGSEAPGQGLCNRSVSRFFNGGPFTGGTAFQFFLRHTPPGDFDVISGRVYDETGRFVQRVGLSLATNATELTAEQLGLVPEFGTIEWTIESNIGHISAIYRALGRYSVSLPATCKD